MSRSHHHHTNTHPRLTPCSCSLNPMKMHFASNTHTHSLGCVLLVVYGAQIMWETMSKYRSFIILMGILLITVGTCKTITRNRDWYSRENLLIAGLRVLPHNAKMHYNFGNFLKDRLFHQGSTTPAGLQTKAQARIHYREAIRFEF